MQPMESTAKVSTKQIQLQYAANGTNRYSKHGLQKQYSHEAEEAGGTGRERSVLYVCSVSISTIVLDVNGDAT